MRILLSKIFIASFVVTIGAVSIMNFVLPTPQEAQAALNFQINYQGKLTNTSDVAVADGDYNMEFRLCDAVAAGSCVWTETRTGGNKVTVTNGLFSVMLGSVTALTSVDFNQTLYLGVNIGGTGSPSWDGEMAPRKIIGTVPSAFLANGVVGDGGIRNTISSATALTVAKAGTDYALQVDTSTASAVTGLKVTSAAAAGGLALSTLSTGANENLTVDAKGSGTISLGATSTGDVLFAGGSGSTGCTVTNSTGALSCAAGGSFTTMALTGAVTGAASYNGLVITANTGVVTTGTWNGTAVVDTYVADTLTVDSSSSVHWNALNNYPAACSAGSAISQLADTTNTCTAFNTDTTITLQDAYNATSGNTITTTDARNLAVTLANVTTPTSFTIENQDTAATSAQRIFNSIASGTATNGLLIEQTGAGTMTNAIQIAETAGTITDGILITGTLGNILNSSSIDITGAGAITGATGITSSGNYVQSAGTFSLTSANTTQLTTSSAASINVNSLTSGTGLYIASASLTSGSLVDLQVSGSGGISSQKVINVSTTGTITGTQTTYGGYFSNTHSGGTSTNVGLYATATGGTNNYAAIFAGGNVGVNTTTPTQKLEVSQGNIKAVGVQVPAGFGGTATTGGSLATNNYYYAITAVDATGESSPTYTYVNVGGANNAVNLSWTASPLATSYNIYRSTSPVGTFVSYNTASTSFNDTGAAGGAATPPVSGTAAGQLQSNMGVSIYDSQGWSLIRSTGFAGGYANGPRLNIMGDYFSFGGSGEIGGNGAMLRTYQGLWIAGSDNTYYSTFTFQGYHGDTARLGSDTRLGQLYLMDTGGNNRFYAYPGVVDGASAVGYTLDTTNSLANASAKLLVVRNQGSEKLTVLASGNVGIGDTSPTALLTVGTSDAFQVNSSGAIAAATGVTSSGTITFSGLGGAGTKCLQTDNSGVVTAAAAACGTGALTPWTSDIDADGYDLNDLSNILFRETAGAPTGTDVSIFRDNAGDLNLNALSTKSINLQVAGSDEYNFSSSTLAMNSNTITNAGSYNGLVVTANTGVVTTGTWNGTAVTVPYGGTGAASFTSNGVLYGNTTGAVQVTAQGGANTVLVANAGAPSFSDAITVGTSVTSPTINATTALQFNGANINTAGTLTNVAYLNQANAFTLANSFTVQSATALTVARTGSNYALQVDTNTASSATGIKITSAAAAGGVAIAAISSGTNENLTFDAKGSGTLSLGGTSTGDVLFAGGSGSTGCTVTNSTGAFACTAGGSFTSGTFAPTGGSQVSITNSTASNTNGVLRVVTTSSSDFVPSISNSYTQTATGSLNAAYGVYSGLASTAVVVGGGVGQNLYGNYFYASKSGADTATGTSNTYATYNTADNTGRTNAGTVNTYGGYFSALGDTSGTSTAIGLYTTASGADNNYAAIFNAGNVGIGTTTPTGSLVVASGNMGLGTNTLTNTGGYSTLSINGSTGGQISFQNATTAKGYIYNDATNLNIYAVANTVFTNGNVGIGDASPASLFTVGSGDLFQVASNGNLTSSNAGTWTFSNDTNFALSGGVNGLSIDGTTFSVDGSSDYVGIGTAAPAAKLHITTVNASDVGLRVQYGHASPTGDAIQIRNSAGTPYFSISAPSVFNNFLGYSTGNMTMSGTRNIAFGFGASNDITTASDNVAIGVNALTAAVDGGANVAIGTTSMTTNVDGAINTAVGYRTLEANVSGDYNTALGAFALVASTGDYNTSVGYQSQYGRTSGGTNTSLGTFTGYNNVSGAGNLFLGYAAGYNETGSNKLYIDNSTTASPLIWGDFSTDTAAVNGTLGVNTMGPDRRLDVLDASNPQIRLTQADGTVYTDLQTDSSGYLNMTSTGHRVRVVDNYNGVNNFQVLNSTTGTSASSNVIVGQSTAGDQIFQMTYANTTNSVYGADIGVLTTGTGATGGVLLATQANASITLSTNGLSNPRLTVLGGGNVGIGDATPDSKLHVVGSVTTSGAAAIAGIFTEHTMTNSTGSGFQYGNRSISTINSSVAGTHVGQFIRMIDGTTLDSGQNVRGLEVQAYSGTNVNGTNTGIATYGYTFGLQAATTSQAAAQATPAAIFADLDNGTDATTKTRGNAIRAYTDNATSADLVSFYQETSTYTGNGLLMNFGNGGGSFSGNFVNLQNAATSKYTISSAGRHDFLTADADNVIPIYINSEESTVSQTLFAIESDTTGNGQSVDTVKAHFEADGSLFVSLTGTQNTVALCHANNGQSNNDEIVDCSGAPSDVAEYFGSEDSTLSAGEIVVVGKDASEMHLEGYHTSKAWVARSTGAYQNTLMGVVSTAPAAVYGDEIYSASENPRPIALAGRVPVKVNAESGPIMAGDFITSSSTPGVGMKAVKAGPVIGQALNSFDGSGIGTVVVFIKATNYNGVNIDGQIAGLTFDYTDPIATSTNSSQILEYLLTQLPNLDTESMSQMHTDVVIANGEIVSPNITSQTLRTDFLSSATADGGLSVASTTMFNGGLMVDSIMSINDLIAFQNDVEFFGTPYFTSDTAGFAVIEAGAETVDVEFSREYLVQPIVNASISFEQTADLSSIEDEDVLSAMKSAQIAQAQSFLTEGISFAITNKSESGFTIVLSKPAVNNIKFSWIALAVRNANTFMSLVDDNTNLGSGSDFPVGDYVGDSSNVSPDEPVITEETQPVVVGDSTTDSPAPAVEAPSDVTPQ